MQTGKLLNKRHYKILSGVSIGVAAIVVAAAWMSIPVPLFQTVASNYQPSDLLVVDRNGYPLESIRKGKNKRSLEWVKWSEVSPSFKELLIQTEDKRFYSHLGIDFLALGKSGWDKIIGGSNRGASTITMQLVGVLTQESTGHRRNIPEKIQQITRAVKMEMTWSKEQILEAYVNLAPLRGELRGLRSASLGYFNKNPSGLNREEAALLVALLRSPNSSADLVSKRTCKILGIAECNDLHSKTSQLLKSPYKLTRERDILPVLASSFTKSRSNTTIQTSLDYGIQDLAIKSLREQIRALKNQNVNDGAVLVIETSTGNVVAYAANAGAGIASAAQIDGIQMRRQAGSTIKPFVYATAFDWNYLHPNSLLDDSPADIPVSQGRVYNPRNYDKTFRGLVSVGDALGSSMNVPAVRALQLVGEPKVLDKLRSAGFEKLQEDEYYGPSMALGTIDVTLWELTQGYRKFAIDDSPFSKESRKSIFNILASPEYRRFTFGMDSLLTLPFAAAVKTGTSKDMRDNWCIGWTPQYVVGVWIGNFNGEPMWNVSGMSGAAPIWRSIMLALHTNPTAVPIQYEPPVEALPIKTITKIRYPAKDMLVGFDPDIPKQKQKLPIEIENPQKGHQVFINNRLLNTAQETTMWPLQRGKFRVELKNASGERIDSVKFEVR
ncbi:penicillin-binding protein 1C [Bdellovibrio sp. KM01]|uniref:penicillin-binding protein 1C n=1 Tax=Bdellovibrio sp. KM01 TaxID=2748865 RepID=UPI0015EA6B83|nr:penicillin-binding protein 1C [Bdellovibrio sp. KM01]QLY25247.1 penicillin-binding protein 1C [Bdellovibrio sp. KM01]